MNDYSTAASAAVRPADAPAPAPMPAPDPAAIPPAGPASALAPRAVRRIVHRTRGRRQGPIVRLVSPSDLGEAIKPFVFLDRFDTDAGPARGFGWHPHSGIATLSLLLAGGFRYEDSTGAAGRLAPGSVEWMQAGGGVWHTGHSDGTGARGLGYQLWVALPPELELAPARSQYLDARSFQRKGPARVILGEWQGARSPIVAPAPINYLEVNLRAGETWRYDPPAGHDVAWIAVHAGAVRVPEVVAAGELAVFERSGASIGFESDGDASFVLGSAVKHPHDLVLGYYSVHTSPQALRAGEQGIERIGDELRRGGTLGAAA
jgi:redox-sensitive bicupin YhaK (pirin superfamily)